MSNPFRATHVIEYEGQRTEVMRVLRDIGEPAALYTATEYGAGPALLTDWEHDRSGGVLLRGKPVAAELVALA